MAIKTEHIIVLMLENRSFDHMLGFLDHGNPAFPRIKKGEFTNSDPKVGKVPVNAGATYRLAVGPDHSHKGTKEQVKGPNKGFVANYYKRLVEKKRRTKKKLTSVERRLASDMKAARGFRGSVAFSPARKASIRGNIRRNKKKRSELRKLLARINPARDGGKVMACFSEDRVPVLSTLAREFCVFTNWYASVPGQTWPNRAFAHAATSDGEVNIKARFYNNRTIFEDISDALKSKSKAEWKRAWAAYHDGPTHLWVYPALRHQKGDNFRKLSRLTAQIADPENAEDPLPRYCFVEPNHGLKLGPIFRKRREFSNNQHPNNNTAGLRDFLAGEQLIADIYNALKANPALFKKTLFLIVYDEHGGFFDDREPPSTAAPDGKTKKFDFRSLGVRVPAVLVSPWIERGTVDDVIRDHSSIVRTVRKIFIGNRKYLTKREAWVKAFDDACGRNAPRDARTLPDVEPVRFEHACRLEGITEKFALQQEKSELKNSLQIRRELDRFEQSLVDLTANVERTLDETELSGIPVTEVGWSPGAGRNVAERLQADRDVADYVENVGRRLRQQSR